MRRDSSATAQAPPTKATPTEQPKAKEKVRAVLIYTIQYNHFDIEIHYISVLLQPVPHMHCTALYIDDTPQLALLLISSLLSG